MWSTTLLRSTVGRPLTIIVRHGCRERRHYSFMNALLLGLFTMHLIIIAVNCSTQITGSVLAESGDFVAVTDASPLKQSEIFPDSSTTLTHMMHPRSSSSSSGNNGGGSGSASGSGFGSDENGGSIIPEHLHPYFDNSTATNVTVEKATTAYLHCRVHQLGDKMEVSWLRRRDYNILTVGRLTYSSDQRFQMLHHEHTNDWTLQIKYAQSRDAGLYECQVSSDPPISHFVSVSVVVATAEIMGAADMYFKSGSTMTITCLITQSPDPPAYVFWYHDNRMINFDTSRGGIAVNTVDCISTLVIANAQRSDSGNYTCGPANAPATSVTVHVLNGEKPEAIQHDAKTSCGRCVHDSSLELLQLVVVVVFSVVFNVRTDLAR